MKSETKRLGNISESRKIRKPLMEKKRRDRINESLEILKTILLESKSSLKQKVGQRTAKLEKADILEMTVRYIQHLHDRMGQKGAKTTVLVRAADSSSEGNNLEVTLVPTRLDNGEIAFVVPSKYQDNGEEVDDFEIKSDKVWRPW